MKKLINMTLSVSKKVFINADGLVDATIEAIDRTTGEAVQLPKKLERACYSLPCDVKFSVDISSQRVTIYTNTEEFGLSIFKTFAI